MNLDLLFKSLVVLCFICLSANVSAQEITAQEIVQKSIELHDPESNWSQLNADININSLIFKEDNVDTSKQVLKMDLHHGLFEMHYDRDGQTINLHKDLNTCYGNVDNPEAVDDAWLKKNKVNCERAKMFDSYYRYLLGMPMKLKDQGTIIDPEVKEEDYNGIKYYVIKVTYEKEVGSYTWLFYFNHYTFQLELSKFSRDGKFNSGETIEYGNYQDHQGMKLTGQLIWFDIPDHLKIADERIEYR